MNERVPTADASTALGPTSERRVPTTAAWGVGVFVAIFGALAVIETALYFTDNIYTNAESARRRQAQVSATLPATLANAFDRLGEFDSRFDRFSSDWLDVTGVTVGALSQNPGLAPRISELLADPAAATAVECWERLRGQSTAYRDRSTTRAQLETVRGRVQAGEFRKADAELVDGALQRLAQWNDALDGHERCAAHLRELLRVRSLNPAAAPPAGGAP